MNRDRAQPRLWQTDWLLLRGLRAILHNELSAHLAKGARLVDLGCGDMPYRPVIEALELDYIGADLGDAADLAISAEGHVDLADATVDAVLSIQVLEHVRDLDAYCAEVRRVLKPEGTLFLSTHGTWLYHPHPEDHRRWTRTGLVVDLETRGFKVHDIQPIAGPLATTTLLRLTGFAFGLRKLPLLGAPLAGLLAIVMNLRAWLEDAITPQAIRQDNACIYWVRACPT